MEFNASRIKKIVIPVICGIVTIILLFSCFTVVSPTERGVLVTMGKAGDRVITPGLVGKLSFFQTVRKYDLSPKGFKLTFSIGQDAAVTSDMQSVACELNVFWMYQEDRILDIVNGYSDSSLKTLVQSNALGAIKEVIGKYSIYDIVEKQEEVTKKVEQSLSARLSNYPVMISNLTINNWDWSSDFDTQIQNTMRMQQQSRIAAQEVEVAKQEAQKAIVQAQADKEKAEIEAAMKVSVAEQEALAKEKSAQGIANAAKIDADAQAYKQKTIADAEAYAKKIQGEAEAQYYKSLTTYADTIATLRQLDIDSQRAENWNGVEVSTYIPLTAAGAVVTL